MSVVRLRTTQIATRSPLRVAVRSWWCRLRAANDVFAPQLGLEEGLRALRAHCARRMGGILGSPLGGVDSPVKKGGRDGH
jgi:hypothetical protein